MIVIWSDCIVVASVTVPVNKDPLSVDSVISTVAVFKPFSEAVIPVARTLSVLMMLKDKTPSSFTVSKC